MMFLQCRLVVLLCVAGVLVMGVAGEEKYQVNEERRDALPIVLWHGMGDTCCGRGSVGRLMRYLHETYGMFVYSIGFGPAVADQIAGYIGNVNEQVAEICERLKTIKELRNGYSAIGFSQGGQFLRAVAQRCNHEGPKMVNLVTLGGQHQGVMGYPGCNAMHDMSFVCKVVQRAIHTGVYIPPITTTIIQAQYYKDPFQIMEYLAHSDFLRDVNNDGVIKNKTYRHNLITLERFVMVKFRHDEMVIPPDSAWFSFYNGTDLIPLKDQQTYKEDWIGLKTLDESGRLFFIECPTDHMGFSMEWFHEHIMKPHLLPDITSMPIS